MYFRALYPNSTESLEAFHNFLHESTDVMTPLKVWQLQELSYQATERVMAAANSDAIKLITHISQNFPLQVKIT